MKLIIPSNDQLSLADADNFRDFSLLPSAVFRADPLLHKDFGCIAEAASKPGHFWIDADKVVEISGRSGDKDWVAAFWAMLKRSEPYGFADVSARKLQAHISDAPGPQG